MSWPEAIFYSVLAICGAGIFAVLIFVAIVSSGASQPRRRAEARSSPPITSLDLPRYVSVKYEGPADKAPDMAEVLRETKEGRL